MMNTGGSTKRPLKGRLDLEFKREAEPSQAELSIVLPESPGKMSSTLSTASALVLSSSQRPKTSKLGRWWSL